MPIFLFSKIIFIIFEHKINILQNEPCSFTLMNIHLYFSRPKISASRTLKVIFHCKLHLA